MELLGLVLAVFFLFPTAYLTINFVTTYIAVGIPHFIFDYGALIAGVLLSNVFVFTIPPRKKHRREKRVRFARNGFRKIAKMLDAIPHAVRTDVEAILDEDLLSAADKLIYLDELIEDKELIMDLLAKYIPEYKTPCASPEKPLLPKLMPVPQIEPEFLDKIPDCLNILILGQTGVGKSTFINGLVNYLKYSSIQEALERGVEILIPTYFTHTDRNNEEFQQRLIQCAPTIEVERGDEGNEHTVAGQSSTQCAKSYVFSIGGEDQKKKKIRIIDTPGVGDVRGVEQENVNLASIMNIIAEFKEIHAICILLKPNESKLNLTFRYCLNEIYTNFPASIIGNVFFCFTNARSTLYRPGDTYPTLLAQMEDLRKKRDIEIPLNKNTMFCFDNESFRFLCAMREGVQFDDRHIKDFNKSWEKTVTETFRMFKVIAGLRVQPVKDILAVANFRSAFRILQRPLAQIYHDLGVIEKMIDDKRKEIEDVTRQGNGLEGRLYTKQNVHVRKELSYPMMVCTSKQCVEYKRLTSDGPMEIVYKTECHENCTDVSGVQTSVCPSPALAQCAMLRNNPDQCSRCSCNWSTHMHVRHRIETTLQDVIDPIVQRKIEERNAQLELLRYHIERETKNKADLEKQAEKVAKGCADFGAYLQKNAILAYNEAYKDYVEQLIREEKNNVNQGADDAKLQRLEKNRDENEQQVTLFKENEKSEAKSTEEVYAIIDTLQEAENGFSNDKVIREIQKLKLLTVSEEPEDDDDDDFIDLSTGWVGRVICNATTN